MKSVPYLLCLLISGLLPVAAQSESEDKKDEVKGRAAWFACTSIPDDLENPVTVMSGDDLIEVELPRYMTSDPVKIPDDGVIRIVRQVPDPEDTEKTKYVVLAQAVIPAGISEALIILFPLTEPEGDLIFQASVQDLAKFKGGDRMFINLSKTNIAVQIGDTNVAVPARRTVIYSAPAFDKPTNMPIVYRFFHPEREEWKMFSASTVVIRPTRRQINIFNEGTRIGNIKKHGILFPLPTGGS